ncbi:vWA domain-containing protein [Aestuariicoccus sp. MJ-SS9]|uniref:vWA domain-containing protein n=1 Tax=Aestuariicoccus sp. MJ-SS9 TaxID=3079855 RepID=UPI002915362D|nr:VWA domain-containing protein [Aestuariicoccus sp. MJ-SS9]MDU8912493.1 VWA domain-containing protein [Aestuariicoccus sp. MJ-SS9]
MINLKIVPQIPARLENHTNTLNALVRVVAPSAPKTTAEDRPPLNLSLVLDRSGSMAGQPLDEAKRAAEQIVTGLRPTDRLAIVAFDNEAEVMHPGGPLGDGRAACNAIAQIQERGMTALHDGWMLGVEQAIAMREPATPARVLLLSDGAANRGLTEPSAIAADCARMADHGITTSTCGLGHHFNEHLMAEMARAGRGNGYYGETAEDLADPFAEEFDLLRNICARQMQLQLSAGEGVELLVLNRYTEKEGSVLLPDLAYDGEAWAVVELRFDERGEQPNERLLLSALVRGRDKDGKDVGDGPVHLRLPRLPASAFHAVTEDETVRARTRELRAAELQEQAQVAARRQDWNEVDHLLREAQSEAGENPWVEQALTTLKSLAEKRNTEGFSKEAMYSVNRMRSRLAASSAHSEKSYDLDMESTKPSYLRRKMAQGKRMPRSQNRNDG